MAFDLNKLLGDDDSSYHETEEAPYTLQSSGEAKLSFTDSEHSRIFRTLLESHPEKNPDYRHDDIGLATLFSDIYKDEVRYCPQSQTWYLWNMRWEEQPDIGAISDKLQTLLNLLSYYCDEVNDEEYRKYIKKCRSNNAMRSVLEIVKSHLRMHSKDMDNNPYILNTTSGAYDLRTGKKVIDITPFNITKQTATYPADMFTKRCDRWYQFIDEIMSGDKEKAAFLQRALGYSLLGVNKCECMFIAYGWKTRNGKGTLFETIQKVLSKDYMRVAPTEMICLDKKGNAKDYNSPQPGLAALVGTRIVSMSEVTDGKELDSASVKALTGRDSRQVRNLYEKAYDFIPQFTMWLSTNYLPRIPDKTVFRSKRIWVIEFNESWADRDDRDDDLKDELARAENLPTILRWLMDGCADYMKQGLNPPKSVIEATERCMKTNDRVLCFTEDCCEHAEGSKVSRSAIKNAYVHWCRNDERDYIPLKPPRLYAELRRFYDEYDDGKGERGFKDVKLIYEGNTIKL